MNCKILMAKDSDELEKMTNDFLSSIKHIEIHHLTNMSAEGKVGISIFYSRQYTNLEKVERQDLEKAMVAHKGDKALVAEQFGLGEKELDEKLKEFDLN